MYRAHVSLKCKACQDSAQQARILYGKQKVQHAHPIGRTEVVPVGRKSTGVLHDTLVERKWERQMHNCRALHANYR